MTIGYYTFENIRIPETFIYDLINGLEKKTELIWYSGQREIGENITDIQIPLGFSPYNNRIAQFLYKIGQLKGYNGYRWRMRFWIEYSDRVLKKKINIDKLPDVGYCEFLTTAILTRRFFEREKIPYVVHIHAYDITSELNDPAYRDEIQKVFKSASAIIVPSNYIKKLTILEGCPENKIHTVRLGIDSSNITPLSWKERISYGPSIIFLGRLVAKKNPIALIYAFKRVLNDIPNAKLTIIGDGNLRENVELLIKQLNISDKVILKGALPRSKSFPILNQHMVYAQHSVTTNNGDKEGAPVSILEASAHALPVVSTIHSGIPEQVIDGKTGLLVQEYDYEAMANKIIYLIKNPDIAESMGKEGRKNIEKNYNLQERVDRIYDILQDAYRDSK